MQRTTRICSVTICRLLLAMSSALTLSMPAVLCAEAEQSAVPDLYELIPKVFLAYGGKEAMEKLDKSYTIFGEQTALSTGAQAMKFRQLRKGENLRIDVEPGAEAAPISSVYDGLAAWKATGKLVEEIPREQAKVLRLERDRQPAILTRFQHPSYTFRLIGRTTHHATPVIAIEVTREAESPETVYVDEKNYQVVAITYKGLDAQSQPVEDVTIDFSQYRPAGGTLVPFKQIQYVNDKPVLQLDLSSIDTISEIDDSQFRRPDRPGEMRLSKSAVIPIEYSHKEILVKVRLNGSEPLDFLFDTAASQTVIDRRTAAELFLDKQGSMQIIAANGAVPAQLTSIPKVEIGEVALSDVQALMLDLTPQTRQLGKRIAGIIGANVINKFAVTIDYGKSQLIFNDASTYKPPATAVLVPFTNKQVPTVKAVLNGNTEVTFLIDTGAAFNNLPERYAKTFLGHQTAHMTEGTGLDGRSVRLATVNVPLVKLGSQIIRGTNFTYSVDQEGQATQPSFVQSSGMGVLGNPFWQNFSLTLDYKFQRLVLQPNVVTGGKQELEQLISSGDVKLVIYRDLRAAEQAYQKALLRVQSLGDAKLQAKIWGRIGNLRRVMAKDLNRPEQSRIAYEYFSKAQDLAHKLQDREAEGRILADWSLLYLDNGQIPAAQQALQGATLYAPQDPQVNVDFAVYLYKMRNYPEMNRYIDKALFLDRSNWQALWYKVKLAEMYSDTQQLKDTLKDIVKFYPWSKIGKDKLAALTAPPMVVPTTGVGTPPSAVPTITPTPGAPR